MVTEGKAISSSQEEATELALNEDWDNNPLWALLRDAGY